LVARWWRTRHATTLKPPLTHWPFVTVQLPLYNERYVVERLLAAVAALDYPRDRFEIQVLDDSTDVTACLAAQSVERLAADGLPIRLLHRRDRTGYKAGALAAGLSVAQGELLAIFDADFVPPRDFLRETVPHFADPRLAMAQARWGHLNREHSVLTRVQAILLDSHFAIEHAARSRSGYFFNFNGTAGIWRRQAIEEAGGWSSDTLTEDLDLSFRAQLLGWRFLFLPEIEVPAELPCEVYAFKGQQRRWAKGSVQTARKLLVRILRSSVPLRIKFEAAVNLTCTASYPLMVLLTVLLFPAMQQHKSNHLLALAVDLPLLLISTASVSVFFLASQRAVGRSIKSSLPQLPRLMAISCGIAASNAGAVFAGLVKQGGVFERTPKLADSSAARSISAYHVPFHASVLVEASLALYLAVCCVLAAQSGLWLSLPFLCLFLHGYTTILALSCASAWRRHGRPAPLGADLAAPPVVGA
jgi:cellulose synthase/poly-beta-1,6-N-acetylglucosamine synthase-like glycosyltransferase